MNTKNKVYVKEQIEPNVYEQTENKFLERKELSLEEQIELFAEVLLDHLLNTAHETDKQDEN